MRRQLAALIGVTIYALLRVGRARLLVRSLSGWQREQTGRAEQGSTDRKQGRSAPAVIHAKSVSQQGQQFSVTELQTPRWILPGLLFTSALNSALPSAEGGQGAGGGTRPSGPAV